MLTVFIFPFGFSYKPNTQFAKLFVLPCDLFAQTMLMSVSRVYFSFMMFLFSLFLTPLFPGVNIIRLLMATTNSCLYSIVIYDYFPNIDT